MGSRIAVIYETPYPAALCRQARPRLGQGHHHTFLLLFIMNIKCKVKFRLPPFFDTAEQLLMTNTIKSHEAILVRPLLG